MGICVRRSSGIAAVRSNSKQDMAFRGPTPCPRGCGCSSVVFDQVPLPPTPERLTVPAHRSGPRSVRRDRRPHAVEVELAAQKVTVSCATTCGEHADPRLICYTAARRSPRAVATPEPGPGFSQAGVL